MLETHDLEAHRQRFYQDHVSSVLHFQARMRDRLASPEAFARFMGQETGADYGVEEYALLKGFMGISRRMIVLTDTAIKEAFFPASACLQD